MVDGHHCAPPCAVGIRLALSSRAIWRKLFPAAALDADPLYELWRQGCGATWRRRPRSRSSRPPLLRKESLQLVDGNEPRAPRHLDRLDERQDAPIEGGTTDAEGLGGLCAGVGKPHDPRRLAFNHQRTGRDLRWRWRMPLSFRDPAPEATMRHGQSVHKR